MIILPRLLIRLADVPINHLVWYDGWLCAKLAEDRTLTQDTDLPMLLMREDGEFFAASGELIVELANEIDGEGEVDEEVL